MDANEQRRDVLRRLGRDWKYPEERAFVGDYIAGRVPRCEICGWTLAERRAMDSKRTLQCDGCLDRYAYDSDDEWHRMVLVEEGTLASPTYWFWHPDPIYDRDVALEILWQHFGPFSSSTRARERLGGEWCITSEPYFRGQLEDTYRRRRYLRLDLNSNSYLVLPSSPAPGPGPHARWPMRPCTVLHAGHPRSRFPKRPVPKRHRKGPFRGALFPGPGL